MSLWNAVCSVHLCKSVRKRTIAKLAGEFFSHRTHRFNRIFLRTVSRPQNASGIQISQSVKTIVDTNKGQHKADILLIGVSRWSLPFPPGEGSGEGPLSLWAFVYSVLLCKSVRNRTHPLYEMIHKQLAGEVFLSQNTQILQNFSTNVSNPQNASGIQISQSVKTIVDTNKGQHEAYIHSIGVSRWSLPFPPGEGLGEGPLSHRTPPAYRKHRTLLLNLAMRFRKEQLSYDDKKILHCFKRDSF